MERLNGYAFKAEEKLGVNSDLGCVYTASRLDA